LKRKKKKKSNPEGFSTNMVERALDLSVAEGLALLKSREEK